MTDTKKMTYKDFYQYCIRYFKNVFTISITLWAIILGTYSIVFHQHSLHNESWYHWINPINILEFADKHRKLNLKEYVQKFNLEDTYKEINKTSVLHLFFVDITQSSSELNSERDKVFIEETIHKCGSGSEEQGSMSRMLENNEIRLFNILFFYRMALEVGFNDKSELYIYKGNRTQKIKGHIVEKISLEEGDFHDAHIKRVKRAYNSQYKVEHSTDILEFIKESIIKLDKNDTITKVLHFISDFKHEIDTSELHSLKETIINYQDNIEQINFFITPLNENYNDQYKLDKIEEEVSSLVKEISIIIENSSSFHYIKDIKNSDLINEDLLRLNCRPAREIDDEFVFYSPYHSKKYNESSQCLVRLISESDSVVMTPKKTQILDSTFSIFTCFDGKRTYEIKLNCENLVPSLDDTLTLKLDPKHTHDRDNLFVDIYDEKGNYKLKYPVVFKEKLPNTATFLFALFFVLSFNSFLSLFCLTACRIWLLKYKGKDLKIINGQFQRLGIRIPLIIFVLSTIMLMCWYSGYCQKISLIVLTGLFSIVPLWIELYSGDFEKTPSTQPKLKPV